MKSKYLKEIESTDKYTIFVDENPKYKTETKCIQCKECNSISYSEGDIERKFCGKCNKFHNLPSSYNFSRKEVEKIQKEFYDRERDNEKEVSAFIMERLGINHTEIKSAILGYVRKDCYDNRIEIDGGKYKFSLRYNNYGESFSLESEIRYGDRRLDCSDDSVVTKIKNEINGISNWVITVGKKFTILLNPLDNQLDKILKKLISEIVDKQEKIEEQEKIINDNNIVLEEVRQKEQKIKYLKEQLAELEQ
jgi:hypothetical protein